MEYFATTAQGTSADTAFGWGNHASGGYLAASSYTAADVLTKIKTVDGTTSGLDADLLDGLHSTSFATSAQGTKADTAVQPAAIANSANWDTAYGWGDHGTEGYLTTVAWGDVTSKPTLFDGAYASLSGKPTLGTAASTASTAYATSAQGTSADTAFGWGNHASGGYLASSSYTAADVLTKIKTVDGTTSGLDADLLDGLHSTSFATSAQGTLANSAVQPAAIANSANWDTAYGWGDHASGGYLTSSSYTAADVLTKIKTVDGFGSGLDADLLDGQQKSDFILKTETNQTISGSLNLSTQLTLTSTSEGSGVQLSMTDDTSLLDYGYLYYYHNYDENSHGKAANFYFTTSQASLGLNLPAAGDIYRGTQAFYHEGNFTDNSANWNTAYGWGDHGAEGYLTSAGQIASANTLTTARNIALSGDVSGNANFNGSANITITATVADDSHNHIIGNVDGLTTALGTKLEAGDLTGYATETYVGTQINNLVDSSPATLDTLNELAAALGDDPNFATTVSASIGTKMPLAGGTFTGDVSLDATSNLSFGSATRQMLNLYGTTYGLGVQSSTA